MNYILLPTLQHAATVRTASLLYNDQEIKNMLFPLPNTWKRLKWRFIRKKNLEKLSTLLPVTVQERVVKFFRQMYYEVERWEKDHFFLLEHGVACNSIDVVWKTDGTINKNETAKKLIMNDNIDVDLRFIMACTYFLEDKILDLWKSIIKTGEDTIGNIPKKSLKKRIISKGSNSAVRFWMKWLKKENAGHWSEMIDGYFRVPYSEDIHNPLRVSSFFRFLSLENKNNYIRLSTFSHSDDFPTRLNEMDESKRVELIKSEIEHALFVCMRWPFRSRFLKMAKEGINNLTELQFEEVMESLLASYLWEEKEDFYILETFWQMTPTVVKESMKNSNDFIDMTQEALNSKNCSTYLKDVVRKFFLE